MLQATLLHAACNTEPREPTCAAIFNPYAATAPAGTLCVVVATLIYLCKSSGSPSETEQSQLLLQRTAGCPTYKSSVIQRIQLPGTRTQVGSSVARRPPRHMYACMPHVLCNQSELHVCDTASQYHDTVTRMLCSCAGWGTFQIQCPHQASKPHSSSPNVPGQLDARPASPAPCGCMLDCTVHAQLPPQGRCRISTGAKLARWMA